MGLRGRYVLSQSTPFIASMYAIFLWKEFKAASATTWILESCMLLSLAVSVVFLCMARACCVCCKFVLVWRGCASEKEYHSA